MALFFQLLFCGFISKQRKVIRKQLASGSTNSSFKLIAINYNCKSTYNVQINQKGWISLKSRAIERFISGPLSLSLLVMVFTVCQPLALHCQNAYCILPYKSTIVCYLCWPTLYALFFLMAGYQAKCQKLLSLFHGSHTRKVAMYMCSLQRTVLFPIHWCS